MKKTNMFLLAVAMVLFAVTTSQAALISLYTFDDTSNNAVAGAPNGTAAGTGALSYVAGVLGDVRADIKAPDIRATKPSTKSASDQGTARMVRIEVLIADVKRSDSAKDGSDDTASDAKTRIEQLEKAGKLDGLTRVQLVTLEGQPAYITMGRQVSQITAVQMTSFGQMNVTNRESLGTSVRLTPRTRPDGRIGVDIQIDRSQLGPAEEGTLLFTPAVCRVNRRATSPADANRPGAEAPVAEVAPVAKPSAAKPSADEAIRIAPTLNIAAHATIAARSGESVVVATEQTKQREVLIVVTPELLDK